MARGFAGRHDSELFAFVVDDAHLGNANAVVDAEARVSVAIETAWIVLVDALTPEIFLDPPQRATLS